MKGVMYREEEEQKVTYDELFFDLFYVGVMSLISHMVADHPEDWGISDYSMAFTIVWGYLFNPLYF